MHARPLKKSELVDQKRVLTKALTRMAERLRLSRQELSAILGPSEATLSRIFAKETKYLMDPQTTEGRLALLLLRLYRSLDMLFGGNDQQCQLWLRSHNHHLCAEPIQLIQSIEGLVLTVQYLDTMRGKN